MAYGKQAIQLLYMGEPMVKGNRLTPVLVLIVTAACGSSVPSTQTATPAASPTPDYMPTFETATCKFDVPEGASITCGYLVVPEDRSGDLTDTIRLAVAIYDSTAASPAPDPIIYLHGGPGGRAVEWSADVYEQFVRPMLDTRDVVMFDQRGSGLSEPALTCDELVPVYLADLIGKLTAEEREQSYVDALAECRTRLEEGEGANLSAYTTRASASDVADLARALGYQQVNLFGISYGTTLAQAVMRDTPGLVRSTVLDSALPLEVKHYNDTAARASASLELLFSACAADPACAAAYPNFRNDFFETVHQLNQTPISLQMDNPLGGEPFDVQANGDTVINLAVWALYSTDYIPLIPQAFYQVRGGDYSLAKWLLPYIYTSAYEGRSLGALISIYCHDQVFVTSPDELAADFAAHPEFESYGFSAAYGSKDALFTICGMWDAAPYDPRDSAPLASDIPTLILMGEFDPVTPPAYGEQLAAHLGHAQYFKFPALGHAVTTEQSTDCPLKIALSFIADPTALVNSLCLGEMKRLAFIAPYTVNTEITFDTLTDSELGVTSRIPTGWEPVGYNFYNRNLFAADPAQIGVQANSISSADWLGWLQTNYQGEGFEDAPVLVEEQLIGDATWQFYVAHNSGLPVDLAFARVGDMTIMVAMQSFDSEREALRQIVFLPVIESAALAK